MLKKQALVLLLSHLYSPFLVPFSYGDFSQTGLDHDIPQGPYLSLCTSLRPFLGVHIHSEMLGEERLPSQAKFCLKEFPRHEGS